MLEVCENEIDCAGRNFGGLIFGYVAKGFPDKIRKAGPHGAKVHLAEATSFDWNVVFYFSEGTRKADIDRVVGQTVFGSSKGRYHEPGPLLVFTAAGKVVHMAAVIPPVFVTGSDRHCYNRQEAILKAATRDPGPYVLNFVQLSTTIQRTF